MTIEISIELARMLASKRTDMKDPKKYDDLQEVAKSLLRVLMENK